MSEFHVFVSCELTGGLDTFRSKSEYEVSLQFFRNTKKGRMNSTSSLSFNFVSNILIDMG